VPGRTYAADQFEISDLVHSYAKIERLGYQIQYLWNGSRRRFIPDFLVRLTNGKMLVLEIKGVDSEQNKAKRDALDLWVRGVNAHGGFGVWCWDVAFGMAQIRDILAKHAAV
jgi:type III restriction enzyme